MPINCSVVKKLTVVVLAGATLAAAAEAGTQALAAGSGDRPVNTTTENQGHPNAVPPILRPARASELTEIRSVEVLEAQRLYYDPPRSARYSSAVLSVFAK